MERTMTLTYAPVSRVTTLRVLASVAAKRNWKVHQVDIKTAFLNGDIDTEVYMEQPQGSLMMITKSVFLENVCMD
jgi:hypothetical protein